METSFEILVLGTRHRPILTGECLEGVDHRVVINEDDPLARPRRRHPSLRRIRNLKPLGVYRCYRGHQRVLERSEADHVLVFEDDAVPNRKDWLEVAHRARELLDRFEVVCLHGRRLKPEHLATSHSLGELRFWELAPRKLRRGPFAPRAAVCKGCTLAYLIRRDAAQRLARREWDGLPVDWVLPNEFRFCVLEASPFDHDRRHGSLVEGRGGG